jgi:hypothetical protein
MRSLLESDLRLTTYVARLKATLNELLQSRICTRTGVEAYISYSWVKGHADHLDRDPDKCEKLNIIIDEICGIIRAEVRVPTGANTYNALYIPSLGYRSCATILPQRECEVSNAPLSMQFCQKMGSTGKHQEASFLVRRSLEVWGWIIWQMWALGT